MHGLLLVGSYISDLVLFFFNIILFLRLVFLICFCDSLCWSVLFGDFEILFLNGFEPNKYF